MCIFFPFLFLEETYNSFIANREMENFSRKFREIVRQIEDLKKKKKKFRFDYPRSLLRYENLEEIERSGESSGQISFAIYIPVASFFYHRIRRRRRDETDEI